MPLEGRLLIDFLKLGLLDPAQYEDAIPSEATKRPRGRSTATLRSTALSPPITEEDLDPDHQ